MEKGKLCTLLNCRFCIIGGESKALGFHQETMEESRKRQDWFCIKLYINFCTKLASFGLYGSRNVISIKILFYFEKITTNFNTKIQNQKHYFQREYETQNPNIIFNLRKFQLQNSKP